MLMILLGEYGWDGTPLEMSVKLLHSVAQDIFLEVTTCRNLKFPITFVYGDNDCTRRTALD